MQHKDGGKAWYQYAGREMRRNRFPAMQGLVCILRNRFEGQDKNQTKILMFAHSVECEDFAVWGIGHGILTPDFCLDIKHKNL
jgi:hypothetical protein